MKVTTAPTVRFNTDNMLVTLYTGKRGRPAHFGTLLKVTESEMKTPSGGSYVQKRVTVRGKDGQLYTAQVKQGSDVVKLSVSRKTVGVDTAAASE